MILPRDNAYLFYFIINKEHFIIDTVYLFKRKEKHKLDLVLFSMNPFYFHEITRIFLEKYLTVYRSIEVLSKKECW